MADVKGGLPTKRISMFKDHEFQVAKITLGVDETPPTGGVLGGAGTSSSPVTCTDDDHNFLEFYLRANPSANKSGNGLFIQMDAYRNLGLYNRTIYTTVNVPASTNPRNPHAIKALCKFAATSSYCQGQATAGTFDMEFANGVQHASMGECSIVKIEAVLGWTSFNWGAGTVHALLKLGVQGGDAAARQKWLNVMYISGEAGNKAAQYMVCNADVTGGGGASAGGLQVKVNATQYWIPLYTL